MTAQKKYDPKLRELVEKVRDLAREYNVGGYVAFASETHTEYAWLLSEPSWSMAQPEETHYRFKTTHLPAEAKKRAWEGTAHMIWSLDNHFANAREYLLTVKTALGEKARVLHSVFGHEPDSYPGDGT